MWRRIEAGFRAKYKKKHPFKLHVYIYITDYIIDRKLNQLYFYFNNLLISLLIFTPFLQRIIVQTIEINVIEIGASCKIKMLFCLVDYELNYNLSNIV